LEATATSQVSKNGFQPVTARLDPTADNGVSRAGDYSNEGGLRNQQIRERANSLAVADPPYLWNYPQNGWGNGRHAKAAGHNRETISWRPNKHLVGNSSRFPLVAIERPFSAATFKKVSSGVFDVPRFKPILCIFRA
jgi:hypothetical protein